MQYIVMILIGLLALVLIALILALPVLIPPLRAAARRSPSTRNSITAFTGLLTFGVTHALVAGFITLLMMAVSTVVIGPSSASDVSTERLIQEASRELWIRQMIPDSLRATCLTTQYECEQAEEFLTYFVHGNTLTSPPGTAIAGEGGVWVAAVAGVFTAAANLFFVERFTRQPRMNQPLSASVEPHLN